ncbi:MAG: hypothetical protein P1V20_30185 [Verrucomicrobiales bacterium]|nr:hypothetical protein [Verrucomicrobiales bacterium]
MLDRFGDAIVQKLTAKGEGVSEMVHDHSEHRAREILELAKSHFEMEESDLCRMKRGDLRRPAIAAALARQTTLSQTRIAEIRNMKNAANVSQQIRRFNRNKNQSRKIKQFIKKSEIGMPAPLSQGDLKKKDRKKLLVKDLLLLNEISVDRDIDRKKHNLLRSSHSLLRDFESDVKACDRGRVR